MLRLLFLGSLLLSVSAFGCAQATESSCFGDTIVLEPGPTCTGFCALAVVECEIASLGTEDECEQNCERERSCAELTSAACLAAFETAVDCAAGLECQDIMDQANGVNVDAYPCRSELELSDQICTGR
jgi:hypothetical protein